MIEEFKKSLQAAPDILAILEIIAELNLADCWLCAGTIRNFVWNQYSF
ncbi:nucleotidyltransferase family protein, partial [Streptococcus ruminantium]|nr:nucleotidyltransferase family protein [Streptococcus ruminantium]